MSNEVPSAALAGAALDRPPAPPGTALTVQPKASGRWVLLLILAIFGAYIAWVTPIGVSLAIQVNALAPDHEEYLGIVLGIGSASTMVFGPFFGQLSDRTRSRLGRRRPWIIGGTLVGAAGLVAMAAAPSVSLLCAAWVLAQIGWSQAANNLVTLQADRLPESQRGKVAGFAGFATMVAPVLGAVIAGSFAADPFLLFLVPGAIGTVMMALFVLLAREDDSRGLVITEALTAKSVLSKYGFDPRRYPDFAWNWIARFLFFFGLTLNTTYTAYFFASRLDIPVSKIGGTVATVGIIGVAATIIGALGSGGLSDRLGRRKVFVVGSGLLFSLGTIVTVFADDLPQLIVGTFVCNLAIGVFSAVDQALFIDVLPERDTDAGRFINLTQFAVAIPQSIAALVAAALLAVGAAGGEKNYTAVYVAAAICTAVGGSLVTRIKSVR